jgi:hypothetical protein
MKKSYEKFRWPGQVKLKALAHVPPFSAWLTATAAAAADIGHNRGQE